MSWPCFGEHLRDKLARQKVAPCIASNIEHKTNDKRGFHSHHLDEYMACSQQKIDILFWCFYHNLSAPFKSIPYSNPTGKDWWKKNILFGSFPEAATVGSGSVPHCRVPYQMAQKKLPAIFSAQILGHKNLVNLSVRSISSVRILRKRTVFRQLNRGF